MTGVHCPAAIAIVVPVKVVMYVWVASYQLTWTCAPDTHPPGDSSCALPAYDAPAVTGNSSENAPEFPDALGVTSID